MVIRCLCMYVSMEVYFAFFIINPPHNEEHISIPVWFDFHGGIKLSTLSLDLCMVPVSVMLYNNNNLLMGLFYRISVDVFPVSIHAQGIDCQVNSEL